MSEVKADAVVTESCESTRGGRDAVDQDLVGKLVEQAREQGLDLIGRVVCCSS